jgi:hypothetical protein
MEWVSAKDRLPDEGIEVEVKFDCKKECEGFAYFINKEWFSIFGLFCFDHDIYEEENTDNYTKLREQINFWKYKEK